MKVIVTLTLLVTVTAAMAVSYGYQDSWNDNDRSRSDNESDGIIDIDINSDIYSKITKQFVHSLFILYVDIDLLFFWEIFYNDNLHFDSCLLVGGVVV